MEKWGKIYSVVFKFETYGLCRGHEGSQLACRVSGESLKSNVYMCSTPNGILLLTSCQILGNFI